MAAAHRVICDIADAGTLLRCSIGSLGGQWTAAIVASAGVTLLTVGQWMAGGVAMIVTLVCVLMAVRAQSSDVATTPPVPVVDVVISSIHEKADERSDIAYVQNVGDVAARNVTVEPVTIGRAIVSFRVIPLLKPGDRVALSVDRISDQSGLDVGAILEGAGLPHGWWLKWLAADEGELTFAFITNFRDTFWGRRTERQTVTIDRDGFITILSKTPRPQVKP